MKALRIGLVLCVLLSSMGCTLSLYSLFTMKDVTYDALLEGVWRSDEATWTIKPFHPPTGRYSIRVAIQDQSVAEFGGRLGVVGNRRYLELTPERPASIAPKSFYGGHFIELHSFWKVALDDDTLLLTSLSHVWLDTMIKKGKVTLRMEKPLTGFPILTASTEELQAFVIKFADDPGAFPVSGDEKGIRFSREKI